MADKKKGNVRFVRIRGRIVPIKTKRKNPSFLKSRRERAAKGAVIGAGAGKAAGVGFKLFQSHRINKALGKIQGMDHFFKEFERVGKLADAANKSSLDKFFTQKATKGKVADLAKFKAQKGKASQAFKLQKAGAFLKQGKPFFKAGLKGAAAGIILGAGAGFFAGD